MDRTVYLDVNGNEIGEVKMEKKSKVRGFEVCSGYEDKAQLPKRNDVGSAGYDFHIISNVDTFIHPNETVKFETGIKSYMQKDEVLLIYIRSSLGVKKNLCLSNGTGVIDSSYYNCEETEGNIILAITNIGDKTHVLPPNAKVAQGIFMKYLMVDKEELVTDKRTGGVGSTGEV